MNAPAGPSRPARPGPQPRRESPARPDPAVQPESAGQPDALTGRGSPAPPDLLARPDPLARPDLPARPGPRTRPRVVPPGELGTRSDAGLPRGIVVELDADTAQLADDVLFGGSPARVLRLSAAGVRALAELRAGAVASAAGAALARRLTDTGMAHPRPVRGVPAREAPALDVTVVIPVRDRAAELARCLAAAGTGYPVLVVDDGSADPAAVAAVCAAHGARLVRRQVNGGPGPARNSALGATGTELIAFLDSDCVPPPDWIAGLAGHFADPLVAAVAPRIVGAAAGPGGSPPEASTLDLGDRPARVAPMTRVAYVPTAALVLRRGALGGGFDEALRYGEDVDLVWRLIEAGWRVRYEPAVRVAHAEPASRPALLRRRFRYGTSAAPLTRRHPGAVAPLVLQPWPTITMAALLARRPLAAGAAFSVSIALLTGRLRANGLPSRGVVRPMAGGVWQTWLGTGRWCGQFAAPPLLLVLARPGGRTARTRWGRRAAASSLLAGPPLAQWARQREGGPLRFTAVMLADQAAYGAGVYVGCLRERLLTPLLPSVSWKPFEGLRTRRQARGAPADDT
jgi:mycofactocin system glycosyltransferase